MATIDKAVARLSSIEHAVECSIPHKSYIADLYLRCVIGRIWVPERKAVIQSTELLGIYLCRSGSLGGHGESVKLSLGINGVCTLIVCQSGALAVSPHCNHGPSKLPVTAQTIYANTCTIDAIVGRSEEATPHC